MTEGQGPCYPTDMTTIQKVRTNEEFARRVGITMTGASRIRSGARIPSRDTLASIVHAFNLDVEDRLGLLQAYIDPNRGAMAEWIRANLFAEAEAPHAA